MQSILKDWHLAEPVRVVPCVHGEELPAVVGEGEDVDLVPADGHQSEDCIILQSEDSIIHQSQVTCTLPPACPSSSAPPAPGPGT